MPLPPTGHVTLGTAITLRQITKFRTRSISLKTLRRGLARRFAVVARVLHTPLTAIEDAEVDTLMEWAEYAARVVEASR